MSSMKSVLTGAVGEIEVVEVRRPVAGPKDALMRIRACGICGTDTMFLHMGGMPFGPGGSMIPIPLGHEPAGEIVEVGAEVEGLSVGDRVVVDPQGAPFGIIGCGGRLGGMSEYLLIENAVVGTSVALVPESMPFDVAALNEPMAVARHCVNRSEAGPADKVVVFGAGSRHRPGRDAPQRADPDRLPGLPHRDLRGDRRTGRTPAPLRRLTSHRVPFAEAPPRPSTWPRPPAPPKRW